MSVKSNIAKGAFALAAAGGLGGCAFDDVSVGFSAPLVVAPVAVGEVYQTYAPPPQPPLVIVPPPPPLLCRYDGWGMRHCRRDYRGYGYGY